MGTNDNKDKKSLSDTSTLHKMRLIIIGLFVLAYAIFVFFLMDKIESEEPYWTRLIFIFSSLEAITFAALGYVFGKEITKKVALVAEKGQKQAKEEAIKANEEWQNERTKGLALAGMIVGNFENQDLMAIAPKSLSDSNEGDRTNTALFLVEKAKEFYPELR